MSRLQNAYLTSVVTYVETALISSALRLSLNAGMPPPPFSTCLWTAAMSLAEGIVVRSGPPLPPLPSAPWQTEQLSAKTCAPSAAWPPALSSDDSVVLSVSFLGWTVVLSVSTAPASPACSIALEAAPGATGPILPSSEKSHSESPCEVPASELPAA